MAGPVASWNTVPVFGTWLQLNGTPHKGAIKFTLPQRIVNTPNDAIFPAGGVLTFPLGLETGSILFDCPILDDPDNFPIDSSVVIKVEELLTTGTGAVYYIRPVAAMAPDGLDLRGVILPGVPRDQPAVLLRGVAGGVAALNGDGQVVDADGTPVTGAVASVNGHAGAVVLAASDVGADAAGLAAKAVSAIDVSNSSGDVAAITTALTAQTLSGFVNGKFQTKQGQLARITTPTTIALGYTNTQAGNWSTDTTHEKVKLDLDILPDANLGAALTIKGGYGVELNINVLGGGGAGSATDAATTMRSSSADGTMAQFSSTLTSATAAFSAGDVGAPIAVPGAGSGGATLYANIASVTNSTTAVLNTSAQTAVTTATLSIGSFTVSSATAVAAGLKVGAIVQIAGAGVAPEGVRQPLWASVRSVNTGAGTFTISEGSWAAVTGATMLWFDVAVRLEDLVGLKLNIYGKGYAGYLLAADATNDTSRRLRSCMFGTIIGNGCAGTIFWKSIEAFGSLGKVMSNTNYGDYVGMSADLHWDHWEGGVPQPTNQLAAAYLWLDRANTNNDLSVSLGDRGTECAIKISGDSGSSGTVGRFRQIRCTMYQASGGSATITNGSNSLTNVVSSGLTFKVGQVIVGPGIPDGTTITAVSGSGNGYTAGSPGTITMSANATANSSGQNIYGVTSDGLKVIGVGSLTVTDLDTTHCVAGLRVIGGASLGVRVLNHRSLSGDINPLVVQPGATGTTPRVDVYAEYRFSLGYSMDLKSGLTSGAEIRLSGCIDSPHQGDGGGSGKYVARSASVAAILDVGRLHQKPVSGATGFIDPTTVALVGQLGSRLDNEIPAKGSLWVSDGAGGWTKVAPGSNGQVPTWNGSGVLAAANAPGGAGSSGLVAATAQAVVTNTTTEGVLGGTYTVPANSVLAGTTLRVTAWGTIDNDAGATVTLRLRLGGVSGTSIAQALALTNASAKTGQQWFITYLITFRANASASTPVSVGAMYSDQTNGQSAPQAIATATPNMTTNRDLVIGAAWSAATATNVARCEGFVVEQVK